MNLNKPGSGIPPAMNNRVWAKQQHTGDKPAQISGHLCRGDARALTGTHAQTTYLCTDWEHAQSLDSTLAGRGVGRTQVGAQA